MQRFRKSFFPMPPLRTLGHLYDEDRDRALKTAATFGWIMAAELVQTTRLYARTCAKIETEWVEELAAHVMTRTVSDPHFDKELGDAAAWERATLAGAVIVPRRKVQIGRAHV